MKLSEITAGVDLVLSQTGDPVVEGLCCDTRTLQAGDLFFCLNGLRVDGHSFGQYACDHGAAALVVEHALPVKIPQVLVSDSRAAMSVFAAAFYGYPAKEMQMYGVTGTKGKTSTAYFLKAILDAAGFKTGMFGTVSIMIGEETEPSQLTTPDPIDMQKLLRRMADAGCGAVVMECSAHALYLKKLEGMTYDVGIFTNLSEDHLDMFKTMENMALAKRRLFENGMSRCAVINIDDEYGPMMAISPDTVTFGVSRPAAARACNIEIRDNGVSYTLLWQEREIPIHLHISGLFNVYNSMGAAVGCLKMGIPVETVVKGLESVNVVPGRLELIPTDTPFRVMLDYAHSPASMQSVLETVRKFTQNRLICVFGCGGNREHEKRPIMGEIAGKLADYTFITSDNPRGEKPEEITAAIEQGIKPTGAPYSVIVNRREAIAAALSMARTGDIVILVGKGHETYQEIMGVKRPFDEKLIVKELLGETI